MKLKMSCVIFSALAVLFLTASAGSGQVILYEEHFTDGTPDLVWESAFFDSAGGTPLTPMLVDSVPGNPSGDGWIGIVETDTAIIGGLGLAIAGDSSLTDYSMEAEIWVDITDGSFYEGIMVRINQDTTTNFAQGYQLVSNFYPPFFISKLRFRKYSTIPEDIVVLQDYSGSDIPGGAPTESGWHTFKIDAQGDLFWLSWDGVDLPNNPQIDTTSTPLPASGYFGIYIFNMGAWGRTACDDIIIEGESQGIGGKGDHSGLPRAFSLSQNYPNPFNPMTTIRVDIPEGEQKHSVLSIYDLRGRRIRTLVDRELSVGTHLFAWDGRDSSGRQVSSGTYIYRMRQGEDQFTRKMLLMK